jgi:uncharacterized membrane protein
MVRNIQLDNLRGIAFILMIIHHIFHFYNINNYTNYANSQIIETFGDISRYLFILLVGYSLVYSYENNKNFLYNRIKRSIKILYHAAIISLITYYYYPEIFIRFGILHFIGLITLILAFIVPYKNLYYIILLIFIILNYINLPSINKYVDIVLGIKNHYKMLEYYPIIKWTPIILIGMILKLLNIQLESLFNFDLFNKNNILTLISENSLNLYTLHVIILVYFLKK